MRSETDTDAPLITRIAPALAEASDEVRAVARYRWELWARPDQLPPDGDWSYWMLMAGRGAGKALANDTPLPTPRGWTTIGRVRPGQYVFDETGRPCRVIAKYRIDAREAYRVTFSDGSSIDACADHLWVTWRHKDRKALLRSRHEIDKGRFPANWPQWRPHRACGDREAWDIGPRPRTTREIAQTMACDKRGARNHCIPVAEPLELPPVSLDVPPYTLGAWLGDGHSKAACITTPDEEVLTNIRLDGYIVGEPYRGTADDTAPAWPIWHPGQAMQRSRDGRMRGIEGSLTASLRRLGVWGSKHIPRQYLRASIEQRLWLLRGLMDTDGSAERGQAIFYSSRKCLADGVAEIVMSLGERCTRTTKRAVLNGRDYGLCYMVRWTPTRLNPFALSRKRDRIVLGGRGQRLRKRHRMIVSCEPIEPGPMTCIAVDSPNRLFLAGRSMIPTHNTRSGSEWIRSQARPGARIALVAPTAADARDVMVEGESGILACSPPWDMPDYEPSKRRLRWPNGAVAHTFSAEDPDSLRGPQFSVAWCDELAAWTRMQDTWDMLQFGLRLGKRPRCVITTTPRPLPLIKELAGRDDVVVSRATTYANRSNLAPAFLDAIMRRYEGTRLGAQELMGEILEDIEGALWTWAMIEAAREEGSPPALDRVVVAIDPAVTSSATSDETGIIVAGSCGDTAHIIADASGRHSPGDWAREAIALYERHDADAIVAEVNQGGDMVAETIRNAPGGRNVAIRTVRAARGKMVRAEPVAALYEQGRVKHWSRMDKLESQMAEYTGDRRQSSPDRLDALVWAVYDLVVGRTEPEHEFW